MSTLRVATLYHSGLDTLGSPLVTAPRREHSSTNFYFLPDLTIVGALTRHARATTFRARSALKTSDWLGCADAFFSVGRWSALCIHEPGFWIRASSLEVTGHISNIFYRESLPTSTDPFETLFQPLSAKSADS